MKVHLEQTWRIVEIQTDHGDVVPGRVWQGHTDDGLEVVAVITRIATANENDQAELQFALIPQSPPSRPAIEAFPMRMIL